MTTMEKLRSTMMLKSRCMAKTGQQLQFGGGNPRPRSVILTTCAA
jgi:hypothetical protein